MITPEVFAAFVDEVEKSAGFSLVGRAAKGLGNLGASAVGRTAKAAINNPKAALITAGGLGATGVLAHQGLKGAQRGYQEHSYGNLPGT